MSSIEQRLKRLEQAVGQGQGDFCTCPDGKRILFEDAEVWRGEPDRDLGPETCPKCGKPRQTVTVVFEEVAWRGEDDATGGLS